MQKTEEQITANAFRFPGIPACVQEFLLCIPFHLLLPFMPLLIEAVVLNHIEPKTLLLFLSVYPLTIGVSSQSRLLFGLTVVISLVYSVFFGLATGGLSVTAGVYRVGYSSVATAMFVHMLERYNRHVAGRELFLEFN